jgi:hypothetical protein
MVASAPTDPRMTAAVSGPLVANMAGRTANVATTVLAPKQIPAKQIEGAILAFVTNSTLNRRFASALARLCVAGIQGANRSVNVTVALLAPMNVSGIQIPVKRATLVANPTLDSVLTLAQLTSRQRPTTRERCRHTGRITVAVLTGREVVEALLTLVTSPTVKIVRAQALAFVVARQTGRTVQVTITSQTLWVLVVSCAAEGTLAASKVRETRTFARLVTSCRAAAKSGTVAGYAVGVVVVTGDALVTAWSTESFSADTLAVGLVANFLFSALIVAIAVCKNEELDVRFKSPGQGALTNATGIIKVPILALLALLSSIVGSTLALSRILTADRIH